MSFLSVICACFIKSPLPPYFLWFMGSPNSIVTLYLRKYSAFFLFRAFSA